MRKIFLLFSATLIASCSHSPKFISLPPDQTGIDFSNSISENDSLNVMSYEYIYNGAGTGIADFNNDGLADIVFAGNQVPPRVYLNEGNFKFRDISENMKGLQKQWFGSVTIIDINNDGWLDFYLTATENNDPLRNKNRLWVNGGSKNGSDPLFTEQAEKYGIADTGYATNAAFFDYDLDGNPDLYILNNTVMQRMLNNYMKKITDGSAPNNDRLYHNNGNGTFTDVTKEAGILIEGYGLGLAIGDVNKDGYPDIYVSNDFMSNDLLYINQRNGTFRNEIRKYMSYQSKSSMGNDMADINNDGYPDMFTLDMMPESYFKKKQTINGFSYIFYVNDAKFGYEHQYLRNMLHLHNGLLNGDVVPYSEIGQILGIYQTDWSWSALFADYDNDGDKDLLITNGFPKDMTDKDWTRLKVISAGFYASDQTLMNLAPAVKIPNVAFENLGNLKFEKKKDWLPDIPSFSYGAAFADLDNDGDLDYVVNNIDDKAFILKNTTIEKHSNKSNYIRIKLKGEKGNIMGLGAKAEIWSGGKYQYSEHFLTRGYASSVDPVIHFGLADSKQIDSIRITWPSSGNISLLKNLSVNRLIEINEDDSVPFKEKNSDTLNVIFEKADSNDIAYTHEQNDFVDYGLYQKIIPHKFSQAGPRMAKGDLNNDGQEDIIIGATNKLPTTVLIRSGNRFVKKFFDGLTTSKKLPESDLAIFDADNDGDNDVVSVAGDYEDQNENDYRHYYYRNDGDSFTRIQLPLASFNASVIRASDFNHDGSIDLFIGARVKNNMFPYSSHSWLVKNNKGAFLADTSLRLNLGMVTDAIWTDYDNDGWEDLLVAREWNSIVLLKNMNGEKFVPVNNPSLEKFHGLWYSLIAGDFDKDGDDDYIAGNLGDNHRFTVNEKFPLRLYALNLEMDGIIDPVMTAYWKDKNGVMTEYPVNYLDELWSQSNFFKKRILNYTSFSYAPMSAILDENARKNLEFSLYVNTSSSYVIWNDKGSFTWEKLPMPVQFSPLKKMVVYDINDDSYPDVVAGSNDYTWEVPTGYFDAGKGLLLINNKKGFKKNVPSFEVLTPSKSGLLLQGMVESLLLFRGDTNVIVAGFNRAEAQMYRQVRK
jgi:hypothetical protein